MSNEETKNKKPTPDEELDSLIGSDANVLRLYSAAQKDQISINDIATNLYQAMIYLRNENKKLNETIATNIQLISEKDEAIKKMKIELNPSKSN